MGRFVKILTLGALVLVLAKGCHGRGNKKSKTPPYKRVSSYSVSNYDKIDITTLNKILSENKSLDIQLTTTLTGWEGTGRGGPYAHRMEGLIDGRYRVILESSKQDWEGGTGYGGPFIQEADLVLSDGSRIRLQATKTSWIGTDSGGPYTQSMVGSSDFGRISLEATTNGWVGTGLGGPYVSGFTGKISLK